MINNANCILDHYVLTAEVQKLKNSIIKKKFGHQFERTRRGLLFGFVLFLNCDWKDLTDFNLLLSPATMPFIPHKMFRLCLKDSWIFSPCSLAFGTLYLSYEFIFQV